MDGLFFRGKLLSIFRFRFWFPKQLHSHMLFGIITMAKLICVISEREKKLKNSILLLLLLLPFAYAHANEFVCRCAAAGILKLKMHRWVMSEQFALHVFACVRCVFHIFCVHFLHISLSVCLSPSHIWSNPRSFSRECKRFAFADRKVLSNQMTCI